MGSPIVCGKILVKFDFLLTNLGAPPYKISVSHTHILTMKDQSPICRVPVDINRSPESSSNRSSTQTEQEGRGVLYSLGRWLV